MDEDLDVRLHRIERQLTADRIALERRLDQVDRRLAELLILLKRRYGRPTEGTPHGFCKIGFIYDRAGQPGRQGSCGAARVAAAILAPLRVARVLSWQR